MAQPRIAVGYCASPEPPLTALQASLLLARLLRLDTFLIWDHLQNIFPRALWDRKFTWAAGLRRSPHECYDYQTILGALAGRAGRVRLGVGVTEPVRRHPVVIAQAALTLAHLTKRAPILGIGAGERENIEPYGLDFSRPVDRLEEALQVIRLCFAASGPLDFNGAYFHLDRAVFDLAAPPGRTPEIWIGGSGPRMLHLAGRYGDGWYPIGFFSPDEYAAKLAVIRAAARAAGRDPDGITPSLQPYVLVAPREREAQAMVDTPIMRFLGLLVPAERWRAHGLAHPFGEGFRGYVDFLPERHTRQELGSVQKSVTGREGRGGVSCRGWSRARSPSRQEAPGEVMLAGPLVRPDQPLAVGDRERRVQDWGRRLMRQALTAAGAAQAARRPVGACPACGATASCPAGSKARRIETVFGPVAWPRQRRRGGGCGRHSQPDDAVLAPAFGRGQLSPHCKRGVIPSRSCPGGAPPRYENHFAYVRGRQGAFHSSVRGISSVGPA